LSISKKKTPVQGSIVPGSSLRNIKNEGFLTVNPEPANLIQSKSKKLFKSDEPKKLNQ
jgi:hypothetical protein